jgi:cytochrome d ubiquinol oxidase subunit II
MDIDITAVWAAIIFFSVFMYVVLDGFDLGIGMLYPFVPGRRERDSMMNSVAPIWDGNETWLVLGGEGLLAAFPIAYAVLGATWLVMKTEDELHERMVKLARPLTWLLLGAIAVVSVWTPLSQHQVAERWFSFPNLLILSPVPLLVAASLVWLLWSLKRSPSWQPFAAALALVLLGFTGMAISIWPHIVPPFITIWEAAAPPSTQSFALVGTLIVLPLILAYTGWAYYVFRGKVIDTEGYH